MASDLLVEEDSDLSNICVETKDQGGKVTERKSRHQMKYAKHVVELMKIKFPVVGLKRTTADYMTLHHNVVSIMTAHKLVDSHIARLAPIVVGLLFVPSTAEVTAQNIVQTLVVEERQREYEATTIDHWMDVWLGYGRRVRYTRA